jgi:hypothetical protein
MEMGHKHVYTSYITRCLQVNKYEQASLRIILLLQEKFIVGRICRPTHYTLTSELRLNF